ncbi:TPA: HNH endonuclease [Escherichia coli]|nr:HNH endonuclease [Escherichia coli]HEI0663013.1 HNH endonuclease [Escherichia coli]
MTYYSRKPVPLPDVKTLNKLFRYDPETGDLYRNPITGKDGKNYVSDSKRPIRRRNKCRDKYYYRTNLPGHGSQPQFMVHRIIFKMNFGYDPLEIDHINGIGTDNRLENLRNVDRHTNCKNTRMSKANTSGCVGVHWMKKRNKWQARIEFEGKRRHLGFFDNFEDAVKARKEAERFYGFHVNHGTEPEHLV